MRKRALHQSSDARDDQCRMRSGTPRESDEGLQPFANDVRVRQTIDDLAETPTSDTLFQLARLLDDAFDECGLEKFTPDVGSDFRTTKGVADNPIIVKTANPNDAFRIADVLEPGYRLRNEAREIIVPARVSIFVA